MIISCLCHFVMIAIILQSLIVFLSASSSQFSHMFSLCAGWSNGAQRHSQIQEEIRHFFALQANLSSPSCRESMFESCCFCWISIGCFCCSFFFTTFGRILQQNTFTCNLSTGCFKGGCTVYIGLCTIVEVCLCWISGRDYRTVALNS